MKVVSPWNRCTKNIASSRRPGTDYSISRRRRAVRRPPKRLARAPAGLQWLFGPLGLRFFDAFGRCRRESPTSCQSVPINSNRLTTVRVSARDVRDGISARIVFTSARSFLPALYVPPDRTGPVIPVRTVSLRSHNATQTSTVYKIIIFTPCARSNAVTRIARCDSVAVLR